MRIIRNLVLTLVILLATTGLMVTLFTALHINGNPRADVIVVLGGGMDADGTLHRETIARVNQGVALYLAGAAPRIHLTGGRAVPNGPGAGDQMAALAIRSGVPEDATSAENKSLSTLQNALFSKPMLSDASSLILVSEAFHLPRATASFWWMGYDDLHLVHSARFRLTKSDRISLQMIGRETLAVWFNFGRAMIWSATGRQHDDLLR